MSRASEAPRAAAAPPADQIEEMLLIMSWFRRHPEALRRTTPIEHWA